MDSPESLEDISKCPIDLCDFLEEIQKCLIDLRKPLQDFPVLQKFKYNAFPLDRQ